MLAVIGPAQTRRQLQIFQDIVIGFAETSIGIKRVRILAEEIIVSFIVELRKRIGIDIDTSALRSSPYSVSRIGIGDLKPPARQFELSDTPGSHGNVCINEPLVP